MKKLLSIITFVLTIACTAALIPNAASAKGEKEVKQEYDEAGRVKTETTYIDGIARDMTVYGYYNNGSIKTVQSGVDLDRDGIIGMEIHFDPFGHGMEFYHNSYDLTTLGLQRLFNPQYAYDKEERLKQFEADILGFDSYYTTDWFSHVKYTYHYDPQGRIDLVELLENDPKGYIPDIIGSTSYYYNDDGSYTTIETRRNIETEVYSVWVCRFDESGDLLKYRLYRSDGRHPQIMSWAAFEPELEDEVFEEWYNQQQCFVDEVYSDHAPSAEDLDEIHADIRYPRAESFYLPYYKYAAVSRNAVKAFIDPNASDVMAASNTYTVTIGEDVVVLAESPGYACVIFPDLERAGWINKDYLTCD